jgi:Ca2+-binding EF-hand superfamily protein
MTSVQEARLQDRFNMWDKDGNGSVERGDWESEAQRILSALGVESQSPKGQALTGAYVGMWSYLASQAGIADGASLSFDAFRTVATQGVLDRGQQGFNDVVRPTIRAVADICDTDGDGRISPDEFKGWLTAIGAEQATADSAFAQIDADGNGYLSVDEMVDAVHKYHAGEVDFSLL